MSVVRIVVELIYIAGGAVGVVECINGPEGEAEKHLGQKQSGRSPLRQFFQMKEAQPIAEIDQHDEDQYG